MEQEGESRGREENKQQPPPHQVVQRLEELMRPSTSTVVPSTSGGGGDGDESSSRARVNQLLIGGGSGASQGPNSETQQLLDMYVLDYMQKRGMHNVAEVFRQEAGVRNDPIPIKIDAPDGLLRQWWSMCFDANVTREFYHKKYVSREMKDQENK